MFFQRKPSLPFDKEYFMALLAGTEGGLATTTAIVAGLMVGQTSREFIVTTATISFLVQAFNGSVGRFSSEHTDDEINHEDEKVGYKKPVLTAVLHFAAHVIMSVLVLLPIIYMTNEVSALISAIAISMALLLFLGIYKGRVLKVQPIRDAAELVILGALIICVGIIAGYSLS